MAAIDTLLGYPIPAGTKDPFFCVQKTVLLEMYPPFAPGFSARVAGLLVLLVAIILLSFGYLGLQVKEQRRQGRDVWFVRLVRRPAGSYLILNQYMLYPILSIVVAALWISLTSYVFKMFGGSLGSPIQLYYWIAIMWIPFYIHLATTTFAVLSGANLASRGSQEHTHVLSPLVANSVFVFLLPVVGGAMLGVGLWMGRGWQVFGEKWLLLYDALGEAGRVNLPLSDTAAEQALLQEMADERLSAYLGFLRRLHAGTIVYVASASLLILINAVGGVKLLATLRRMDGTGIVPANTPIVAPLALFPLESAAGDIEAPVYEFREGQLLAETKGRLKRLEWDTILFFVSVVPACAAFIGFSCWEATQFTEILTHSDLLEFACLGMVWIDAGLVVASLCAMTSKSLLRPAAGERRQSRVRHLLAPAAARVTKIKEHMGTSLQDMEESEDVDDEAGWK